MTTLQQRIVHFYHDELIAVQQPDGTIFVLFARLCENLGLARWSQVRRIQHHAVLNEGLASISLETERGRADGAVSAARSTAALDVGPPRSTGESGAPG